MESSKVNGICGIYKITSPSGKIYIGQSVDCIRRELEYRRCHCKRQPKLFSSLKKYGWANHRFEVICECDESHLDQLESYYITMYGCFDTEEGLNLMEGGGSCGRHSEETKRRQSEVQKGNKNHRYGKPAWNRGVTHSEATKIKLRRQPSAEAVQKRSGKNHYMYGKKHTEQHKIKIAELLKGNKNSLGFKHSIETINKRRLSQKGQKRSEAAKNNMSVAQKGLKKSNGHKLKLSIARSKLVLNIYTGIFYQSSEDAWKAYGRKSLSCFRHKLIGRIKNDTLYRYAQ